MTKLVWLFFLTLVIIACQTSNTVYESFTKVSIEGEKVFINGKPTFEGRKWQGYSVEGLLPNSRMVQGVFDDLNPETVSKWKYPDTGEWDANRNTDEFINAMPLWKEYGLLSFTICFQGGSPEGYSKTQPWENNGYDKFGNIRPAYAERMERIIKKADEHGMVVILCIFYFGQDQRLGNEQAVIKAVENVTKWVLTKGFTNVLIEVANESNVKMYDHEILRSDRIHELLNMVKGIKIDGERLLVGTSMGGSDLPPEKVVEVSDFILLHGNSIEVPSRITEMVNQVRALKSYRPMPIIFNEDDHYDFDQPENNFTAATKTYASWGFFDFRQRDEAFEEGYQCVPVDWTISSERKKAFFQKVKEIFID